MSTSSDAIKEKLAKLFAMAENNNNSNEVAIALEKARKLMVEYNLSKDDIQKEQEEYINEFVSLGERNKEVWKACFGALVAKNNFCKAFTSGSNLHFFGKKKNVSLAIYQYNNIIGQIERICDFEFYKYKSTGGKSHGKTWKNNFYMGAYSEISLKLQQIQELQNEFILSAGESQQLVVIDTELNTAYKEAFPKNTKSGRYTYRGNDDGYSSGKQAGKDFSFNVSLQ